MRAIAILLAACWACSQGWQSGAQAASPAAAASKKGRRNSGVTLQRLSRLLPGVDAELGIKGSATAVKLGKELVKGLIDENNSQPPARLAEGSLKALGQAAAAAATPLHRGQLLLEQGRLLQAVGRAQAALEAVETAGRLFHAELACGQAGEQEAATAADAGADGGVQPVQAAVGEGEGPEPALAAAEIGEAGDPALAAFGEADGAASAAAAAAVPAAGGGPSSKGQLSSQAVTGLLDCVAVLRQLGQERPANALLAAVVTAAPRLPSAASYLRGVAQLSEITDEQLAGVLSCVAAAEGQLGPQADACAWMRVGKGGMQEGGSKPVPDLHRLYYSAHRGLHARKQYSEAWRALEHAKRLHFQGHNYTAKDYGRLLGDVERLFPLSENAAGQPEQQQEQHHQQQPQQQPGAADGSGVAGGSESISSGGDSGDSGRGRAEDGARQLRPIFVLGLPRSGSSLVEQILASHPLVWGVGEFSVLRPVATALQQHMANGSADAGTLAQLRRRYLSGMRAKVPRERQLSASWLVDKALVNAWYVGHIARLLPEACVVHAVRHPADAALSSFQQSFFPKKVPWSFNLSSIAANVASHHRVMRHWDRVLPGRVLHLHYAHMVADQEGTTRRLVEHCGLPWDPALLRFYETQRSVQTASQLQVKKPIYATSLNKWHAYKEGLAPLLLELRDVILRYEEQAGLESSAELLNQLATQFPQAAAAQRAEGQAGGEQPHGSAGPAGADRNEGQGLAASEAATGGQDSTAAATDQVWAPAAAAEGIAALGGTADTARTREEL